jgi:membrane protein required for colicin V production
MNTVDLGVIAVLAISALLGFSRGLVREVLSLGAWVLAAWGAWRLFPFVSALLRGEMEPDIADPVAGVGTFLVLLVALSLLANLIGRVVRVSALGGLDRTLGFVFGLGRGAVLLMAAYVLAGLLMPPENWPEPVQRARSVPLIYQGAAGLTATFPAAFRPRVAPPPAERATTAEALLHVTPEGRALGPGPVRD